MPGTVRQASQVEQLYEKLSARLAGIPDGSVTEISATLTGLKIFHLIAGAKFLEFMRIAAISVENLRPFYIIGALDIHVKHFFKKVFSIKARTQWRSIEYIRIAPKRLSVKS